jgi:endonuclease-3
MADFKKLIGRLRKHYGDVKLPPAHGPFELVMRENCCYLLPDERRATVFHAPLEQVGMHPLAIQNADQATLLALAKMGGMHPGTRASRWREIASLTLNEVAGNLDRILSGSYAAAKKALKQFPSIGDPGAACGSHACRIRENAKELRRDVPVRARGVERRSTEDRRGSGTSPTVAPEHGKTLCKNNQSLCIECPVADLCGSPMKLC